MMDAYTVIKSLRAVRHFADRPVPDEVIRRILEAGRWTGSSKNTQPWHFIVIRKRDTLERLAQCGYYASHLKGAAFAIGLVIEPGGRAEFDAGRCAQNLMLAAWAHGVGSCIASMHQEEAAKAILGIPPEKRLPHVISFGYPSEQPQTIIEGQPRERVLAAIGRRPLAELVHWEKW